MTPQTLLRSHQEWLSSIRPVGLVVSARALVAAGASLPQDVDAGLVVLQRLLAEIESEPPGANAVVGLRKILVEVLGFESSWLTLLEEGVVLRPLQPSCRPWSIAALDLGTPLDLVEGAGTHSSPQALFERSMRERGHLLGLLWNGRLLRLIHAPRGEASGYLTWDLRRLLDGDRVLLAPAFFALLGRQRLESSGEASLERIVIESRKYRIDLSNALADQVLGAVNELLRGLEAAGGSEDRSAEDGENQIYEGVLSVLMRLIFVLYAEDRALTPNDSDAPSNSMWHLLLRLRRDVAELGDRIDGRFGAWSELLSFFRMFSSGRSGHLDDSKASLLLEGDAAIASVSDGCVHRVLEQLMTIDGERISYRALEVEQIGSIYEKVMGFSAVRVEETSAVVGSHQAIVGLESLLAARPQTRARILERHHVRLGAHGMTKVRAAQSTRDLLDAFGPSHPVSGKSRSPKKPIRLLAKGAFFLRATDERRRSGSHYTPRELTEPVVRTTLAPLLRDLGEHPTPASILAIKVCDPAMGSGAFLVETCRQLADALLTSWGRHEHLGTLPVGQDPLTHARRAVAERCLYGVDKNPLAVELGKLSLWLLTLSSGDHLTFVEHSLCSGDSLVGLSVEQIVRLDWSTEPSAEFPIVRDLIERSATLAASLREDIRSKAGPAPHELLLAANAAIADVRLVADAIVGCFFSEENQRGRRKRLSSLQERVVRWLEGKGKRTQIEAFCESLASAGIRPFHWEIEFPEVFLATSRSTGLVRP